jgi:hypothetical protein
MLRHPTAAAILGKTTASPSLTIPRRRVQKTAPKKAPPRKARRKTVARKMTPGKRARTKKARAEKVLRANPRRGSSRFLRFAENSSFVVTENSRFVSGHRFSDAVSALGPHAPLGLALKADFSVDPRAATSSTSVLSESDLRSCGTGDPVRRFPRCCASYSDRSSAGTVFRR